MPCVTGNMAACLGVGSCLGAGTVWSILRGRKKRNTSRERPPRSYGTSRSPEQQAQLDTINTLLRQHSYQIGETFKNVMKDKLEPLLQKNTGFALELEDVFLCNAEYPLQVDSLVEYRASPNITMVLDGVTLNHAELTVKYETRVSGKITIRLSQFWTKGRLVIEKYACGVRVYFLNPHTAEDFPHPTSVHFTMEKSLIAKGAGMLVDIEERIKRNLHQVICDYVSLPNPFFFQLSPCDAVDLAHPSPEGVLRFEIWRRDTSQPTHVAFGCAKAQTGADGEFTVWDSGRQELHISAKSMAGDICMVVPLQDVAQSAQPWTMRKFFTPQPSTQTVPDLILTCHFRTFAKYNLNDDDDAIGTALESQPARPWLLGNPPGPLWMLRVDIYHAAGLPYQGEFDKYELSVSTAPPARLIVGRDGWRIADPAPPVRHILETLKQGGEGSARTLMSQLSRGDLPEDACFENQEIQQAARVMCGNPANQEIQQAAQGAQTLLQDAIALHRNLPQSDQSTRIRDAVWNETFVFIFESDGPGQLMDSIARAQVEINVQAKRKGGGLEALGSFQKSCVDLMKKPYSETICEMLSETQSRLRARLQLHPFVKDVREINASHGPPGQSFAGYIDYPPLVKLGGAPPAQGADIGDANQQFFDPPTSFQSTGSTQPHVGAQG